MPGQLDGLTVTASKLIGAFGKSVTLTRNTVTPNPATGIPSVSSTTEPIVITPPAPFGTNPASYARRMLNMAPEEGDLFCMVAADDVTEPEIGDQVAIDGDTWQIVAVGRLYSGNDVAAYPMGLRR